MIIEIRRDGDSFIIGVGSFSRQLGTEELKCSEDGPYYYNYAALENIKEYFGEEAFELISNMKDDETITLGSKNFVKIKDDEKYSNLDDIGCELLNKG